MAAGQQRTYQIIIILLNVMAKAGTFDPMGMSQDPMSLPALVVHRAEFQRLKLEILYQLRYDTAQ